MKQYNYKFEYNKEKEIYFYKNNNKLDGGFYIPKFLKKKDANETKTFEIKKTFDKNIKALYIKNISGKEKKENTVSSFIFNKAVEETNSKLGLLYDSRNTRSYCEYYVEKIPIIKDNIRWTPELEFEFKQENNKTNYNTYLVTKAGKLNIDLETYLKKLIKTNKKMVYYSYNYTWS